VLVMKAPERAAHLLVDETSRAVEVGHPAGW
jgi:hypothetical protein